jgi:hypothetical protein
MSGEEQSSRSSRSELKQQLISTAEHLETLHEILEWCEKKSQKWMDESSLLNTEIKPYFQRRVTRQRREYTPPALERQMRFLRRYRRVYWTNPLVLRVRLLHMRLNLRKQWLRIRLSARHWLGSLIVMAAVSLIRMHA